MLGLKLNHVSKRGHRRQAIIWSSGYFTDAYMRHSASLSEMLSFQFAQANEATMGIFYSQTLATTAINLGPGWAIITNWKPQHSITYLSMS